MTEKQLETLLEACKPISLIMLQCGRPRSQQERANEAWERLGKEMRFDYTSVIPSNKGNRFFTAETV